MGRKKSRSSLSLSIIESGAKQVEALPITRHDFHGDWNYTLATTNPP